MKKILSIMFAFLLIFSCFAVTAFAEDMLLGESVVIYEDEVIYDTYNFPIYDEQPIMKFSDDFTKLYVDGEPFSRADVSMLSTDFGYTVVAEDERDLSLKSSAYLDLTDEQRKIFKDIYIEVNPATTMYRIELYYSDGSSLTVYFLKDSLFEDYERIISGNADKYLIDFAYPDGNMVITQKEALFGEIVTLRRNDLAYLYDYYYVTAASKDLSISMYTGVMFILEDNFFYVDYTEAGIEDADFLFDDYSTGNLAEYPVHKITDEKLIADLQSAQERYYEDDYGVLYDDDATESISAVFLIFIFAVVPAVILVISLVKAIRGKGVYKKIYGTVSSLCMAELIVFTIIAVIFASSNTSTPSSSDYVLGESNSEEYIVVDTDYSNEDFDGWYSL